MLFNRELSMKSVRADRHNEAVSLGMGETYEKVGLHTGVIAYLLVRRYVYG
jgi:hypothetical protein